jgi:hypothetical protein
MFDHQLSAEILASFPTSFPTTTTTTTTTKQNVDPAVYYVYSRVKNHWYFRVQKLPQLHVISTAVVGFPTLQTGAKGQISKGNTVI